MWPRGNYIAFLELDFPYFPTALVWVLRSWCANSSGSSAWHVARTKLSVISAAPIWVWGKGQKRPLNNSGCLLLSFTVGKRNPSIHFVSTCVTHKDFSFLLMTPWSHIFFRWKPQNLSFLWLSFCHSPHFKSTIKCSQLSLSQHFADVPVCHCIYEEHPGVSHCLFLSVCYSHLLTGLSGFTLETLKSIFHSSQTILCKV